MKPAVEAADIVIAFGTFKVINVRNPRRTQDRGITGQQMGNFRIELKIRDLIAAVQGQQIQNAGDETAVLLHADIRSQDIVRNRLFPLVHLLGNGSFHHAHKGSTQVNAFVEAVVQACPHHVSLVGLENGVVLERNLDRFCRRKQAGVDDSDFTHHVIHRIVLTLAQQTAPRRHAYRTLRNIGSAQRYLTPRGRLVLPHQAESVQFRKLLGPCPGTIVQRPENILAFDFRRGVSGGIKGRIQVLSKGLHPRKNDATPGLIHREVVDKIKDTVRLRFQLGIELIQPQDGDQLLTREASFRNEIFVTVEDIGINDIQPKILVR